MSNLSKTQIGNMALSNLGAKANIESFSEASKEARAISLWYDHSRITTLEDFNWNFATKRATLTSHSEIPPAGIWGFRYQYPADCLVARYLQNPEYVASSRTIWDIPQVVVEPDSIPFQIEMSSNGETKTILTDLEGAVLVYTFDQQDTTHMPRNFAIALSFMLAYFICIPITGRADLKEAMGRYYQFHMQRAAGRNSNEAIARPPREAESIRARL